MDEKTHAKILEIAKSHPGGISEAVFAGAEAMHAIAREREAKLEAALEFYANPDNWIAVRIHDKPQMRCNDNSVTDPHEDYFCRRGGAIARQTLAEHRAEKGE